MRIILTIFAILSVCIRSASAEELTAVATHAYWVVSRTNVPENDDGHLPPPKKLIIITLLLTNTSDHVVSVPTEPTSHSFRIQSGRVLVSLVVKGLKLPDGVKPVMPEAELKIVRLAPGETAVIEWKDSAEDTEGKSMMVRFSVDGEIASRYKLWHGVIEVESKLEGVKLTPEDE